MAQNVISVTQLNEYIRSRMDADEILAGVAVGFYKDFADAVSCIGVTRTHVPNEANRAVYDRTYATYRELYTCLMPVMHKK